jgi:heme/copper-type cytochrome/quinol oxidase subunit 2
MATTLAEVLFWIAAVFIVLAQALILRSTRRGMRHGPRHGATVLEWGYAVLPAIALALTLVWTWRTMHDATVRFESRPPVAGAHS